MFTDECDPLPKRNTSRQGLLRGEQAVRQEQVAVIDRTALQCARQEVGNAFPRVFGYYREDAIKSLAAIELAMRRQDAAGLVGPAHRLKGGSLQLGAESLGALAERIELTARRCVEKRRPPDELLAAVTQLRPLLEETMAAFDREPEILVVRRPGFGRKVVAPPVIRA